MIKKYYDGYIRHSKKIKIVKKIQRISSFDIGCEIILGKDNYMDIPEIDIRLDGYFPAAVRLWPMDRASIQNSPNASSFDSGLDNQLKKLTKILCCKHLIAKLEERNIRLKKDKNFNCSCEHP